LATRLFRMTVRVIKKPPVLTKQTTVILIKVQSFSACLRTSLVCIRSCLQSVLRYKFLILDTYHGHCIFTWARIGGSVVIFRRQMGYASNKVSETLVWVIKIS